MNKLFTTWLLVAAFSVDAIASSDNDADDPVVSSFERELNREPAPAKDVTRDEIDEDVLYTLVNKPLQSEDDEINEESIVAGADK